MMQELIPYNLYALRGNAKKNKVFAGNVCFSEFDDAANLLAANPDAVTISIDEPTEKTKKKHGRLQESGREEDDELLGTDDSDKTEVLMKTY